MSIRVIHYDVTSEGISPAVRQKCGVQGDHNVTMLEFELSAPFYNSIINEANGRHLVYRFEGYDSVGSKAATQFKDLNESVVKYSLENWLTENGGDIKVVLVISAMDALEESALAFELYTFPAVLSLYDRPDGENVDVSNRTEVETLAEVARNAAAVADAAREAAITAQEKTEAAKAALEQGTEWVFNGGDATSNIELPTVIQSEVTENSKNAVSSSGIFNAISSAVARLEKSVLDKTTEIEKNIQKWVTEKLDPVIEKLFVSVEEEGTSGVWVYRKWSSGMVELWAGCEVITSFTTKAGEGHYEGDAFPAYDYPFPITQYNGAIHVQFSLYYGDYSSEIDYCLKKFIDAQHTPVYAPYKAALQSDKLQITGRYYVMARWK